MNFFSEHHKIICVSRTNWHFFWKCVCHSRTGRFI